MIELEKFKSSPRLWEIGRGDAVRMLRSWPDESIDAFVTDPPYGIELKLGTRSNRNSIAGDGKLQAQKLWKAWIPEAFRLAKRDSAHLVFGTWKSPWMEQILSEYFTVKGCIAWDKKIIGLGHYLRPRWEMIYLCVKGKPPRRMTAPADVWPIPRIMRTRHPCEKPVKLLREAIRLVSDEGQIVADPFAGIFSTGVAALLERRRFVGCEINGRHEKLGRQRLLTTEREMNQTGGA